MYLYTRKIRIYKITNYPNEKDRFVILKNPTPFSLNH